MRGERIRVLYSFPHKIGAGRICHTGWSQVTGLAAAGADVRAFPAVVHRALPPDVRVETTLSRGGVRVPYRAIGHMRAFALHDAIVARRLERLADRIDVVHTWPSGALRTLQTARRLGIPTVLERPNAHTGYAYDIVEAEARRLEIELPRNYEHARNTAALQREEREYALADALLCPSEFVARTFLDRGFAPQKLLRHRYGFDADVFFADAKPPAPGAGLTMLFAGLAAVRKGLHFALEAWLRSTAHARGEFLIAGDFLPAYAEKLAPMLDHPSVRVLGYRDDVPDLMRRADVFVLPSLEEGYPLACVEARASGCVPVVSDAAAEACTHMENALVHRIGDVDALTQHITLLDADRDLLARLRAASLTTVGELTWERAGIELLAAYGYLLGRAAKPPVAA